jgi:hypothetical protein
MILPCTIYKNIVKGGAWVILNSCWEVNFWCEIKLLVGKLDIIYGDFW